MWWLVPIGVFGAAAAIYSYFSSEEEEAAKRWEHQRERVAKTVEQHCANIEKRIAKAQESFDFQFLRDLHHSSFRVADEAFRLKRDAETTVRAMERMIDDARKGRRGFYEQRQAARDPTVRERLAAEMALLDELIANVTPHLHKRVQEKRHFTSELALLNERTRMLKEAIRDRCGPRGRDWYDRLAARAAARRASR